MSNYRIVGIGEVLWDVFPDGPRFGGAPANFACHAASLGAEVFMVSRVGADELGEKALAFLEERRVNTSCIAKSSELPTGIVRVTLDEKRSPSYEIAQPVAWDTIEWTDDLSQLAAGADAVCWGTLAQRHEVSRTTILSLLRATPGTALRVFDVNLRQAFYSDQVIRDSLELTNVLKLNDDELPVVAKAGGVAGSTRQQLEGLCERYSLRLVAMTRGASGALLVSPDAASDCAGYPANVRDSVGAGDSFTATLTVGLLQGLDLDVVNRHACRVAAYVCSQAGATPSLPIQLRSFD